MFAPLEPSGASRPAADRSWLGVVVPTLPQAPEPPAWWSDVAGFCGDLEAAGAGSLWVLDHLAWWSPSLDALTVAGLALAGTTSALVGTGVLQLPLRPPALVAKAAATLHLTGGGRFVLGVGTGSHLGEFDRLGVAFGPRRAALRSGIDELRGWWRPGPGTYDQRPAPAARVPIWIGGSSTFALEVAGSVGDGWMPHLLSPQRFAERRRVVVEAAEAAGRPADAVTTAPVVYVSIGRDADRRGRAWLASLFRADPDRIGRHLVAGSAAQVADRLGEFRTAGADHVIVMAAADDPRTAVAALATATGQPPPAPA